LKQLEDLQFKGLRVINNDKIETSQTIAQERMIEKRRRILAKKMEIDAFEKAQSKFIYEK